METRQAARDAVKVAVAGALQVSGLRWVLAGLRRRQAGGRRVLIVSYHRVVEDVRAELKRSIPGLLISQRTFRRHLEEAAAAGFDFASLGEALEVLAGRRVARRDLLVVTFDDGYRDVYHHGLPVLRRMGVPAVIYLPAALIGTQRRFVHDRLFHVVRLALQRCQRQVDASLVASAPELLGPVLSRRRTPSEALDDFISHHSASELEATLGALESRLGGEAQLLPPQGELMDWDEVRRMAREGIELGAHTLDHRVLTHEPLEVVEREVRESKALIEREAGVEVQDFAYCNGWYSEEVVQVLRAAGFRSAVTTEDLPNRLGEDPFTLKRKVLWEGFSRGLLGTYSGVLTGCHMDDCFNALGLRQAVRGRQTQRRAWWGEEPLVEQTAVLREVQGG